MMASDGTAKPQRRHPKCLQRCVAYWTQHPALVLRELNGYLELQINHMSASNLFLAQLGCTQTQNVFNLSHNTNWTSSELKYLEETETLPISR